MDEQEPVYPAWNHEAIMQIVQEADGYKATAGRLAETVTSNLVEIDSLHDELEYLRDLNAALKSENKHRRKEERRVKRELEAYKLQLAVVRETLKLSLESDPAELREYRIDELAAIMSAISEDHYAAGWMVDLEYDLWQIITEDETQPYGFSPLEKAQIYRMRELSAELGGWLRWGEEGEEFVEIDDWQEMYAERRRRVSPGHLSLEEATAVWEAWIKVLSDRGMNPAGVGILANVYDPERGENRYYVKYPHPFVPGLECVIDTPTIDDNVKWLDMFGHPKETDHAVDR